MAYGGPIRSTLEICRGMQLLGHEVKVITTYGLSKKVGISPNHEIIRSGVPVTYFLQSKTFHLYSLLGF